MKLVQTLTAASVIETAQNYARADDPLARPPQPPVDAAALQGGSVAGFYEEGMFWEMVLAAPGGAINQVFEFNHMILSEWVARVPGLAWKPESALLRETVSHAQKNIGGYAYPPETRSVRVMAGVGTLRLPRGEDGALLGTLMLSGDVSAGVPALISAEVWERIQQDGSCEGRLVSGRARWVSMAQQWAASFPVIRSLPRGYLLLNDPDAVSVGDYRALTYITPFAIMEYEAGGSELFDYVYAGAQTAEEQYRAKVEDFFDRYRRDVSPLARYLTAADMVQPLWDADFLTPAQLRAQDPGARSQLSLLEARVREHMLGKAVLGPLLDRMGQMITSPDDLVVLSGEIELPVGQWLAGGSLAEQVSQFVDAAAQREKLDELVVRLAARYPGLFLHAETGG